MERVNSAQMQLRTSSDVGISLGRPSMLAVIDKVAIATHLRRSACGCSPPALYLFVLINLTAYKSRFVHQRSLSALQLYTCTAAGSI